MRSRMRLLREGGSEENQMHHLAMVCLLRQSLMVLFNECAVMSISGTIAVAAQR